MNVDPNKVWERGIQMNVCVCTSVCVCVCVCVMFQEKVMDAKVD